MYPYYSSISDPYRQQIQPGLPPTQPQFPSGPPSGVGGPQQQFPPGPPPSQLPQDSGVSLYAVDPEGIRRCLYRYTYIRLRNGRRFWFFPIFVGRYSIAGYRWIPNQYRWIYSGIDLKEINYFSCQA
ncbi:transporter [Bacillus sp. CLL-7-23]|uniref:Transporter n=1 Tax=Bacillus changyiensis TaxID=3004103 RepID=A0ABT4X6V5_9BACI|nr:transporter [Bacillus changyiensis]MDA7027925.1 transporter [Bacillus changyiensis]